MKTLGDTFTSQLHSSHLRPIGFKKTRHKFSRSQGGYTEYYQIQGSSWNAAGGPWAFYINCGIAFDELPSRSPDRDFPGTHIWTRARVLLPGALPQYEVDEHTLSPRVAEVADVICKCSEYFARQNHSLRDAFLCGRYPGGFFFDSKLGSVDA